MYLCYGINNMLILRKTHQRFTLLSQTLIFLERLSWVKIFQFTGVKLTKKLRHYYKMFTIKCFYYHSYFQFLKLQNSLCALIFKEKYTSRFLSLLLFQLFHKIRVDTSPNEVVPVTKHPLAWNVSIILPSGGYHCCF